MIHNWRDEKARIEQSIIAREFRHGGGWAQSRKFERGVHNHAGLEAPPRNFTRFLHLPKFDIQSLILRPAEIFLKTSVIILFSNAS